MRIIRRLVWICCLPLASQEQEINLETESIGQLEIHSIPGVLKATRDVFSRAVAFDFSQAFFKRRSLGPEQTSVLINGVPMNRLYDGRAAWSNWGGLNDALRYQEFENGIRPSNYAMGRLSGIVNIRSFAGLYTPGIKVSVAASNRSYQGRWMITYSSPWLKNNWKINASASTRLGSEGFRQGTPYEANSFLLSVDKKIGDEHFFNFTAIAADNRRGMSSPLTDEVFQIKGNQFNSYWGYQNGAKRNSRIRTAFEPIFQLNYQWTKDPKTILRAHLTYQYGNRGTSRLDFGGSRLLNDAGGFVGGGVNPDPVYYQKLPSYFLRRADNQNFAGAHFARQRLIEHGQIDWQRLYQSNLNFANPTNSTYALYEDRVSDASINFQGEFLRRMGSKFELRGSIMTNYLKSEAYALMLDLLGGKGFLDIDPFESDVDKAQSDLRQPNRIVGVNDRFRYNYKLDALDLNSMASIRYSFRRGNAVLATGFGSRNFQREGLYENGSYPGELSMGKGAVLRFTSFSLKTGVTYKLNGRQLFEMYAAFNKTPPFVRDAYSNLRESNNPVVDLKAGLSSGLEFRYQLRLAKLKFSLTTYWTEIRDKSRVSFYYADGLTGLRELGTSAFVQEVKTGIGTQVLGAEMGFQYSLTDGIRIKGAGTFGMAYYTHNPALYVTSDDLDAPIFYGPSFLKGYRLPNGPQEAYSLGFEYSDPTYWWIGVTLNAFRSSFVQVAPVTRTKNFQIDSQGFRISSFDENLARDLLKQERLPDFELVNLVGGKSWKIGDSYMGIFVSIGNVLNTTYKTGGFEQSRNANYATLHEDQSREFPLFPAKYWYGYGTTFFTSVYLRIP